MSRPNAYRAPCHVCGVQVPALAGALWFADGEWRTAHKGCHAELGCPSGVPPPGWQNPKRLEASRRAERRAEMRFVADHGGDGGGRWIAKRGRTERWACIYCGRQVVEVKATRRRAFRVRCPDCGGICQPMTAHRTKGRGAKAKPPKKQRCKAIQGGKRCQATLAAHRDIPYCNACFNAMGPLMRLRVLHADRGRKP